MREKNRFRKVDCIICKTEFLTNHSQGKYCSEKCRRKGWRKSWVKFAKQHRKTIAKYGREWYYKNKEKRLRQIKKYQKSSTGKFTAKITDSNNKRKFPEKIKARIQLRSALARGDIRKSPCKICSNPKVEGHHNDYTKPLNIRWLCILHHKQFHAMRKR